MYLATDIIRCSALRTSDDGWRVTYSLSLFFSGAVSPSLFACIWKNCVASQREGDNPFVYPELHHRLCQAQQTSRQSCDGPTNLTAPAHHQVKSAHHIKAAWERRPREADADALLCHFAGVFIEPLTCCMPGTFRGSIQVAKMGKRVERLPRGWVARTSNLPGGPVCVAVRGRDRVLKQICVSLFCAYEGCIHSEIEMDFIPSWLYSAFDFRCNFSVA